MTQPKTFTSSETHLDTYNMFPFNKNISIYYKQSEIFLIYPTVIVKVIEKALKSNISKS